MFSCQGWRIKDGITLGSISAHRATHQDRNLHPYIVVKENYGNTSLKNQILMEKCISCLQNKSSKIRGGRWIILLSQGPK